MLVDPIQHLVPDEDHIIGVALITDEESQKELLSYKKNGICEFYTDEVNSLATLADWLEIRGNIYAIISDGDRHNPNMYILCNGSDEMKDYRNDFVSDRIVCKRSVNEKGTEKEIVIHYDQGHIWLICTRKDEPGSYYLRDQRLVKTDLNAWRIGSTAYAEYNGRTYEHHVVVAVE
jgi:predicted house-cleaning noncanonical NTP pyrophosphatase (MazG superfamily)